MKVEFFSDNDEDKEKHLCTSKERQKKVGERKALLNTSLKTTLEKEKMEKQKVNGKLKFNLKIENLYVKNKRIKDIFKSFLKYANY